MLSAEPLHAVALHGPLTASTCTLIRPLQRKPDTMGKHRRRLIAYDPALVPEGGCQVYACATALALSYRKDPAGHIFHLAALKQSGLYGEAGQLGRGQCEVARWWR